MKPVVLSDRDRELLRLCYEQQVVSFEQVRDFYFDGNDGNAFKRLVRLQHGKLIKRADVRGGSAKRLYQVAKAGREIARGLSPLEIRQRREFHRTTLEHDLLVTSTRLRLMKFWQGSWVPEAALKAKEYPQIPDGLVLFPSGRKVAIELENSCKGAKRYRSIWKRWAGTGTLMVLYVATSPAVSTRLKQLLVDAPPTTAFGLVSWEELRAGQPPIWTARGELDLLARGEL